MKKHIRKKFFFWKSITTAGFLGLLLFFSQNAFVFAQESTTTLTSTPPTIQATTTSTTTENSLPSNSNLQKEPTQDKEFRIIFRGHLLNKDGKEVEDGRYNLRCRIYDSPEGGEPLWEEVFIGEERIPVSQGIFQVTLGRKQKLNLDFENGKYWLGITVGGKEETPSWDEEMKPRKKITPLEKLLKELEEKERKEKEKILKEDRLIRELLEKIGKEEDSVILINVSTLKQILQGLSEKEKASPQDEEEVLEENLIQNVSSSTEELPQKDKKFSIIDFFRNIFLFIKEKISIILEKIIQIINTLADLSKKVTAIYNVVVLKQAGEAIPESSLQEKPASQKLESPNQESGSGIIFQGETSVRIISRKLQENSKIFITFSASPPSWEISKRVPGKYFVLSLNEPADKDYSFDWWVLNAEENSISSKSSQSQEATTTNATSTQINESQSAEEGESTTTQELKDQSNLKDQSSSEIEPESSSSTQAESELPYLEENSNKDSNTSGTSTEEILNEQ